MITGSNPELYNLTDKRNLVELRIWKRCRKLVECCCQVLQQRRQWRSSAACLAMRESGRKLAQQQREEAANIGWWNKFGSIFHSATDHKFRGSITSPCPSTHHVTIAIQRLYTSTSVSTGSMHISSILETSEIRSIFGSSSVNRLEAMRLMQEDSVE